ncbi:WD repeat-containing protein 35, partial [Durusdinium trenchii]
RAPTPMVTAAFCMGAMDAPPCPADVEGVRFHAWSPGYGLAEYLELPLAKVLKFAADAFAQAARGSSFALIVESVKLMPVTRALETFGAGSILSSLSDPLEALVASKLLRKRVEVLCGTKLLDYLNQLSLDSLKSFDAVWLGYDGGRAMTSASLHGCSEWSHLNALLSLRLLSENALLA